MMLIDNYLELAKLTQIMRMAIDGQELGHF